MDVDLVGLFLFLNIYERTRHLLQNGKKLYQVFCFPSQQLHFVSFSTLHSRRHATLHVPTSVSWSVGPSSRRLSVRHLEILKHYLQSFINKQN